MTDGLTTLYERIGVNLYDDIITGFVTDAVRAFY